VRSTFQPQSAPQSAETRIRLDLHTFGFRPDLSRRSLESRILVSGEKEQHRSSAESVATDVASILKNLNGVYLGPMADYGTDSFDFFEIAYSASEPVAEYLLAGTSYIRNSKALISSTLKAIYLAPAGWGCTETINAAAMVLRVLASIPDDRQQERILLMMQNSEKPSPNVDHGVGLLQASRAFYGSRPTQHYATDIHFAYDRYVSILKELFSLKGILKWMYDNRSQWSWMERDLLDSHSAVSNHSQLRGNYSTNRDLENRNMPIENLHHSDSEMPGYNDSEEEDDDSHFEDDGPSQIYVQGAGHPAVNGLYTRDGRLQDACKYTMEGKYKSESVRFMLFQCNVSNNTKHWYISIVPRNGQPGTSTDIDFYSAPVTESCTNLPPLNVWTKSNEGKDPPPKLAYKDHGSGGEMTGRVEQIWSNSDVVDDGNHGGQTYL